LLTPRPQNTAVGDAPLLLPDDMEAMLDGLFDVPPSPNTPTGEVEMNELFESKKKRGITELLQQIPDDCGNKRALMVVNRLIRQIEQDEEGGLD
jgi:hypothetical protein